MLAEERRDLIMEAIVRRGAVRVAELSELLLVSDMTVRRDLDVMQSAGLLEKVHGGAVLPGRRAEEPGFEANRERHLREKLAIAQRAATLARRGTAVGITAGTTTWHLVLALAQVPDLTVVTNSPNIAAEMQRVVRPGTSIILTGGAFRTPSDALVGPVADRALRWLNVDILFLGVHGMDPEAGLTTPNLAEAETNRTFMSRARRVVVVADHTKWHTVGLHTICALSEVDAVVTDAGLEAEGREGLAGAGPELILAPLDGEPATSLDPGWESGRGA
ncbi:MAG: DeoR/GlpR family DNA-binding transcription regulator [Candidatus Dormibacteraeota bacterium]|nr:DeoR/GlpR family DNA-binding transcription regulator [Candidatus Dormibacteraeota bacterium]